MDFKEKRSIPNPREKTNPVSTLFFTWMRPLFKRGYKNALEIDDLFNVMKEDVSDKLGHQLSTAWETEIQKANGGNRPPKLYKAFLSCFFWKLYFPLVFVVALDELVVRVVQSLCLKWVIESFSDNSTRERQYLLATGVCALTIIHTLLIHPTLFALQHLGMKCRIAACSLIYRKALKLSKSSQGQTTIGQLVNLLSNDVIRFDTNLLFIAYLFVGPIQLVIFSYFLWEEVGPATMAGIGFVIFLMPVEWGIGKLFTVYRFQIAKKTDERGRIMNEIIIAMRVIKMYAWEKPFATMVNHVRALEVKVLRKAAFLRAIYLSLFIASSKMNTFFIFLTFVLTKDEPLTAAVVFFTVTIFNVIRQVMISYVPTAAAAIGELVVSLNRIETYLLLKEQGSNEHLQITGTDHAEGESVEPLLSMDHVSASWTSDKVTLNDLTLNVRGDKLVMVVGQVGSGKTSLLHALLAELPISAGKCVLNGKVTYASQEPWIFAGNVRQNILFGNPFNGERYREIVHVCALEDDFKQLPYGDNTIVGERGVALSGGQKARVNLARALYRKSDVYLLDDPLSAVDARVSRHIFEKCVKKYLTGDLRILVTHQLQYLPQADHIVVFNNGGILAQGTYNELVDRGIDFVSLMASETAEDSARKDSTVPEDDEKEEESQPGPEKPTEQGKPVAQEEKMAGGSVTWKTYWEYFRSGDSNLAICIMVVGFLVTQCVYNFTDWWLTNWTKAEAKKASANGNPDYLGESTYLNVYTGLVIGIFSLTVFRAVFYFFYSMRISINVHNRMFGSLVRAPTKFFDDNPSGRVMNRFTKDLGSMDELLPPAFFDTISIFLFIIGMIVLVCMSNVYMTIPTALLIISLGLLRGYYIRTARSVKRIEAITRSPIFTHLAASFQGLTTIRAAGAQDILMQQFDGHQDIHSSAWFTFISANRWFGIWLELMSNIFLILVAYSFLIMASIVSNDAGDVGLAISSALALTGTFQWGMRQSAETENLMTSVERALEYSKLEPEAALESTPEKKPPKDWPKGGQVTFRNMFLAYEEKDVLKNLSFDIKAQEKIGIVGRTGAGKSSIIAGLFRMTEPKGDIFIDGVRITDIGLHDLRRNISIIPQDPVLFSGTMRYNLDPFDQFKDDELWQVLKAVELSEDVPALDFQVSDGGSNFSVGQRQLVCLARAILRKNKIIVMDEATANVDPRTDNFIQTTIRTKFADCSIITIAHRLHSVMDCDRILVLDNGYLKEYDHPHVLLQDHHGHLSSMLSHTGKASETILRQVAADTFSGRRGSFHADTLAELRKSFTGSLPKLNEEDDGGET